MCAHLQSGRQMKFLLLPGLDGTGALHTEFREAIGPGCAILSYPAQMSSYAALLDWVMPHLPPEPFAVIAESFSGPLAIQLAHCPLPQCKALIFVASFARAPRPAPVLAASALNILPVKTKLACQMMQPAIMGRWASRGFTTRLWRALKTVPAATMVARLQEVLRADETAALPQIKTPMLYLQPRRDRLVPQSAARPFVSAGAALSQIDGPHFLLQAQPKEAAHQIHEFVAALDW